MSSTDPTCSVCSELPPPPPAGAPYPRPTASDEQDRLRRIHGCLLGGAIGDAVGRLVRDESPIPSGPLPASLRTGGATQLALFSAEGMVRMFVRYKAKGIGPLFSVNKHAYDRWLFTQAYPSDADLLRSRWGWGADRWPDGWLVQRHELHQRRSAMATTVAALRDEATCEPGDDKRLRPRPNASRGAGGVVRAAPGGLLVTPEFAFEMGVRLAGYTHGHPDAFLSAGVVSAFVCRLVHGQAAGDALAGMRADLQGWPGSHPFYEVLDTIARNEPFSEAASPAVTALVHGAGAALREESPLAAVQAAATAGGSAAAVVAGQLTGVAHGVDAWSTAWRDGTDLASVIKEMAEAVGVAHRAWDMNRDIPGATWQTDNIFEEHPVSMLLWSRFPGW